MSRLSRRKAGKPKKLSESPKLSENSSKATLQSDISQFFCSKEDSESTDNVLPEGALPSPDDAALPCSTSLCTDNKNAKNNKENCHKDMVEVSKKKKKRNKNKTQHVQSHLLTEYFPVRRSNRKPRPLIIKEKQKTIEDALVAGNEEDFEVKEFPGKGRGVVSKMPISKGDFVLEYHGELISPEEAKEREIMYSFKENTGCYMYYFRYSDKRYCVDATKESGRLGRLINHSKKGNLKSKPVYTQDCPRLAFFATRDIEPGEELCYDYGDRRKVALESHPWLAL